MEKKELNSTLTASRRSFTTDFSSIIVRNPMRTGGFNRTKSKREILQDRFKNLDLPEDFTLEEYEELDKWYAEKISLIEEIV